MATLIYLMMTLLTLIILRTNDIISVDLKVALGSIYATLLGPGAFFPEVKPYLWGSSGGFIPKEWLIPVIKPKVAHE